MNRKVIPETELIKNLERERTKKGRKLIRNLNKIFRDGLWPTEGFEDPDPLKDTRHWAIYEVLCSIPEEDYRKLEKSSKEFWWFIPYYYTQGFIVPLSVTHFPRAKGGIKRMPYSKVLYLSPLLEKTSGDITLAIVAHEIAHLVLNHDPIPEDYGRQENEAWGLVRKWGFKQEAKKYHAMIKRRETMERKYLTSI